MVCVTIDKWSVIMYQNLSIKMKIFLPVAIVSLISIIFIAFTMKNINEKNMLEQSIEQGEDTANQYKEIRAYYRARKMNFDKDLSKIIASNKNGIRLKLYDSQKVDEFGKKALESFEKGNIKVFSKRDILDEKEVVRVAVAGDMLFGDVRGVLEVIVPIQDKVIASNSVIKVTVGWIVALDFFIFILLHF